MQESGANPSHQVARSVSFSGATSVVRLQLARCRRSGEGSLLLCWYFVFRGSWRQERATPRKSRSLPAPPPPSVEGRGRACRGNREQRYTVKIVAIRYTQWRILLHPVALSVTPSGAQSCEPRFGGSIRRLSIRSSPCSSRFSSAPQARRASSRRLVVTLLGYARATTSSSVSGS